MGCCVCVFIVVVFVVVVVAILLIQVGWNILRMCNTLIGSERFVSLKTISISEKL